MILVSKREGKIHQADFSKGLIVENLRVVGETDETGTEITFTLDESIWKDEKVDVKRTQRRIKQLSYLNPGLTIDMDVDATDRDGSRITVKETHHHPDGLKEYVGALTRSKKTLTEIIEGSTQVEDTMLSIAFTYTDSYSEDIHSFCNNINTENGGDHLTGFKTGITKAIGDYIANSGIKIPSYESDDTREGIVAIISLKTPQPRFEGQAKGKLKMPEFRNLVKKATEDILLDYLDKNPHIAKSIVEKIKSAAQARLAAKRARDNVRKTKELVDAGSPKGMADCASKKPEESEVFIVEGDSAGGSAKQGRDRKTQAILPIFGKILNTEKSRLSSILSNLRLQDLLRALKCGIDDEFDIKKLRYHKIIIMSDADVDGAHIATLYMTFFYRYLKELVEAGHIYIAMPPLYKVSKGKKYEYAYSDAEKDKIIANSFDGKAEIQRYKGLGRTLPFVDANLHIITSLIAGKPTANQQRIC